MTRAGRDQGESRRAAFQHLRLEGYQRVHLVINGSSLLSGKGFAGSRIGFIQKANVPVST
jgi:hypothetical protein